MTIPKTSYSRRSLLKGAAAFGAASTLGAPMIWAQNIKDVTLRQFGTGVSMALLHKSREGFIL